MGLINDKLRMYRSLLNQEMKAAQWYQIPVWADMLGFIGGVSGKYPLSVPFGSSKQRSLKPTYKPIEVLTDFQHQGGWEMDIPIAYPFTDEAIYGDNPAMGNEESRKWAYNKAIINRVRKSALRRDGLMGEHALNAKMVMSIMDQNKEEFTIFNQKWQAYAPYDALTRRFSRNILASKANGGFGHVFSQQSHPNFYAAGSGKATWSDIPATYETNVNTALDTLSATSTDYMSSKLIDNVVLYAGRLRITGTKVGGMNIKLVGIISDAQAIQLFNDDDFVKAHVALVQKVGDQSPLFTGNIEAYLYHGVLLIVDMNAPGVWTNGDTDYVAARGTVNYGSVNPIANPVMESDRKLAFFFGASAIMCGFAKSLQFKSMNWDYESKEGEASDTIVGYNRSDIYDNDGFYGTAGNFKENTSSLIVATYSPNSPSW